MNKLRGYRLSLNSLFDIPIQKPGINFSNSKMASIDSTIRYTL